MSTEEHGTTTGTDETSQAGCPVMHTPVQAVGSNANRHWWPNQLNLAILRQNPPQADPMGDDFDYAAEFNSLDFEELARDVGAFEKVQSATMQTWKQKLERAASQGRRPVIWGAGSKCVALLGALGGGAQVEYVVDINPHKHGKYLPGTGHEILSPEFLAAYRPELVVAMNPIYRDEIAADLSRRGIHAEVIAV